MTRTYHETKFTDRAGNDWLLTYYMDGDIPVVTDAWQHIGPDTFEESLSAYERSEMYCRLLDESEERARAKAEYHGEGV